jgi:hypothetical protein
MNIELLRKVQDRIRAHAELFDMDTFTDVNLDKKEGVKLDGLRGDALREACGTTCCIAGEALYLDGKAHIDKFGRINLDETFKANVLGGISQWDVGGAYVLGLTQIEGAKLFYRDKWPTRLNKKYDKAVEAGNHREKARVACEVIDDFINTNGWANLVDPVEDDDTCQVYHDCAPDEIITNYRPLEATLHIKE